jgi:hypothetical protein
VASGCGAFAQSVGDVLSGDLSLLFICFLGQMPNNTSTKPPTKSQRSTLAFCWGFTDLLGYANLNQCTVVWS